MTETQHRPSQGYPWQQDLWQALVQRLANGALAHAYLLAGAPGIGKTDFATAFAAYLLCQDRGQGGAHTSGLHADHAPALKPCGVCKGCSLVAAGNHPDLLLVTPEEKSSSIKIEQIRALGRFAQQTAHAFACRVVILTPAEALGAASANALLKVLEEPPADTYFLLLSDQPGLLMPTIRSRCQTQRMPVPDPVAARQWLQEACPDSAQDDTANALALSANRPLAARRALQQDTPALRRELLTGLAGVLKSQLLPIELARRYDKNDRVEILTLMQNCLANLLRYQATGEQAYLHDSALRDIAQAADISPGDSSQRDLHALYSAITNAMRQLQSTSNPNPQLTLENSLIDWQCALGHRVSA